ncbi:MAG: type 2 isopentenyl-diphosphate Delta-isomerase [Chloroflexota bacterium]|nr:MAG: isopentenyl-diphosphate delta-isomerase [Bellilinea sp.]
MDSNPSPLTHRKADHIRINLEEDVTSSRTTGLERYYFLNEALPDFNLADVDTSLNLFGKSLRAPLLISSMTGGTTHAGQINLRLAAAAQEKGIALGLGSQRAALEHPEQQVTFQVRSVAPDILLFANLGAVQLNYGYSVDHCLRAIEMAQADGLFLHLNPLQEALQPEGDTNFSGLLKKIEAVCKALPVPVIAKEVGWGISAETARRLVSAGVAAIDVAGAGGTSWSQVEMYRMNDPALARIASTFRNWGIPTAEAVRQVHQALPNIPIFASGGLRNGLDIAKCIALGATLGGMAGPFLKAAVVSAEEVATTIDEVVTTLRIAMFASGAPNLDTLRHTPLWEVSS